MDLPLAMTYTNYARPRYYIATLVSAFFDKVTSESALIDFLFAV